MTLPRACTRADFCIFPFEVWNHWVNLLTVLRSFSDDIHNNRASKVITFSVILAFFTTIVTKIDQGLFCNTTRVLKI